MTRFSIERVRGISTTERVSVVDWFADTRCSWLRLGPLNNRRNQKTRSQQLQTSICHVKRRSVYCLQVTADIVSQVLGDRVDFRRLTRACRIHA